MARGSVALSSDVIGRRGQMSRTAGWPRNPVAFTFGELEMALEAVSMPVGGLALDPFAGAGSVATRVAGRGDRFFGIEGHPFVAELAQAKLARPGSAASLRIAAEDVAERARSEAADVALGEEH